MASKWRATGAWRWRRWSRKGPRSVLIIEARFYEDIADELARGAIEELEGRRIAYERIAVPGSLEIPLALSLALANGFVAGQGAIAVHRARLRDPRRDAHYDIVARGIGDGPASARRGACRADRFRHLHLRQPRAGLGRASVDGRNKGRDAARACLNLMQLEQHFSSASRR